MSFIWQTGCYKTENLLLFLIHSAAAHLKETYTSVFIYLVFYEKIMKPAGLLAQIFV